MCFVCVERLEVAQVTCVKKLELVQICAEY